MSEVAPTAGAVREPQQARSRASWERVLAVGRDLLESGGYDALTISEVCRRAGVSAPSIYARVDGRTGLFRAVYEDGMREIAATEDELFAQASRSIAGTVAAMAGVFDRHRGLLRAVIRQAVEDPWLLERGAEASRGLQARVVAALPRRHPDATASAARALYEACAFRTIYGPQFWSDEPETLDAFCSRLVRITEGILASREA